MELTIPEQLAQITVRIECELSTGQTSTGTGFFFTLCENIPVIFTNKHVIDGAKKGKIRLTLSDGSGRPVIGKHENFEISDFESWWKPHPDPNIDLCAMPIAPILAEVRKVDRSVFFQKMDFTIIPTEDEIADLIGLEEITMVGYPNGLWDKRNNLPVFRKGIIATDYKYDWNGHKEFVIDAACFPGSSGSPVFLYDANGYVTRKGYNLGSYRLRLLGVLYAGPQHTVEGDLQVQTIPTSQSVVPISNIPINLGYCIKSELLRDFEPLFSELS